MIRLTIYLIGITLILASCNILSPNAGAPSSTQLVSDLISPTPDTVQSGDSDAQDDSRCEPVDSTTIPASSDPRKNSLLSSTEHSSTSTRPVSNEVLPAWVGTPAAGNPPRSELPLPESICNGDIVLGQDNLIWFIWENTKSRVWFPGQWSENDLSSLPDGSEMDRRLIGLTQPDSASGYLAITDKGNVFWIDPMNRNKYPLILITVSQDDLIVIPTAYGEQYYPTLK